VERIGKFSYAPILLRGSLINFARALHIESFMRTLVVKLVNESVELGLLLKEVRTAGRVASIFKVRCMRSWRPFCCGWPGWILSMVTPSLSHQTASLLKLNRPLGEAKGIPLPERGV